MARFNEILVGRYNRFLQKLLSMKGGSPAPQLASEINVGFVLFNGVENRYLEGWNEFGITILQPAGVGLVSGIRFRNPAGSNVMAVFEKIQVINQPTLVADAPALQNGPVSADLSTVINLAGARRDPRGNPNPSIVSSRSGAGGSGALANNMLQVAFAASQLNYDLLYTENQEITLLPGDAIQMQSGGSNIGLTASFMWRERFLEDSERT